MDNVTTQTPSKNSFLEFFFKYGNKIKEIGFLILSFVIPFVALIILMQVNNIALFSYTGNTIMMIDMKSEYVAYMSNLKYMLEHGGSFVYTTGKVFGGDYMSIYTFYMASPFNFLIVFFPYEAIPLFFVWSSIIKMSFASLNMYLLARLTGRFSYGKLVPAIGYGLISYSFIYMSNYMWLDGVMILPLCILGLYFLKDRKHLWLYPLTIAYSLLTSWYIGFMICIFVALYFVVMFFIDFKIKNKANYLFLLRFAVFSIFGGMLSSLWWFTAFIHLSGTKGTIALPEFFNFSISVLLSGFMENNYSSVSLITQYNSYMSMFVGVAPLVFAITYFFNSNYSLKERLFFLGLVLFYFIIASNSVFSALFHGGREPTWFPTRFSFIIGFIICDLASKNFDRLEKLNPLSYIAPTVIGIIALIIVAFVKHSERLEYYSISVASSVLYFVVILIGVGYSIFNYYEFKKPVFETIKKISPLLIIGIIGIEVISSCRGSNNILKVNTKENQFQSYEVHLDDVSYNTNFNKIKTYEKEHDNDVFYRMEATFNRPGNYNNVNNNPMFYNYAGLSNFSSSSKKEVESYMEKIGFHYNGFFSKYDGGSTFAINSFLGIKYLVEDETANHNIHPYFLNYDTFKKLDIDDESGVSYYYNPYATSLSYISDKSGSYFINEGETITEDYIYWFDKFEYQNQLFKTLDNSNGKPVFYPLDINSVSTSIDYIEDICGLRTYLDVKKGDSITINFTVPSEAYDYPLYFSEKESRKNISYYIDNINYDINTYWHKGIRSFLDNATHKHTLKIVFTSDYAEVKCRPELYYENIDVTKEYLLKAKENAFVVDSEIKNLHQYGFNGHINVKDKENKDLIFTIPHEKEVHVKVDGKEVETYTKYNIFTAIDLSSLEFGEHKISIYYSDNALLMGSIITFIGLFSFVPVIIFYASLEDKIFYKKKED